MDNDRFDRISRRFAQPASRRSALGLAALLAVAATKVDAGGKHKKRKNRCRGGCGPCQVCKRQGKKKHCVTARDGAPCDGGTCHGGACSCVAETCGSVGRTCGPAEDGCGSTLSCGLCSPGATPACAGGTCSTCATACPTGCLACYSRPNGATLCGISATLDCSAPCTTDADCPTATPTCVAVGADRGSGSSVAFSTLCGTSAAGMCVSIAPC